MNGYHLSECWFEYVANNSDKVELKHTGLYLYIVELFNKRNWSEVVGLPTDFTMSILNIKSYKTYKSILDDLISFGFVKLVEKAKNDHTANKIALVKNTKVNTKVSPKYIPKKIESKDESKFTIIETIKPETIKLINTYPELLNKYLKDWILNQSSAEGTESKKKLTKKEQFLFDFDSDLITVFNQRPAIQERVLEWIDYKYDTLKDSYKTLKWLKGELKHSDFAINEAISYAIKREYKGFFPESVKETPSLNPKKITESESWKAWQPEL